MDSIDYIMGLLDWNQSTNEQEKGLKLAGNIECINAFLLPCNKNYNKNVWDNCAKILSNRTDEELTPYLLQLLEWLRDFNWPGALCIFDRLKKYTNGATLLYSCEICLKHAVAEADDVWANNLNALIESI